MYAGAEPFSERESQALAKYLNKTKEDIAAYLSLHTFSQKWMTPFGHTAQKPERYSELVRYSETLKCFLKIKSFFVFYV